MNRSEKESFVAKLTDNLKNAQAMALLSFSKISVEQMTSFRLSLSKKNIRVKVVKNTLAKKVLDTTPFKDMTSQLEGPTLLVYGDEDPILTSKAIWEWADKEDFNVQVKTGAALGKVVTVQELKALSKLPGKKEMFVGFLWALKSSPTKFLYALSDAPKRLGYALGALKAKKENNT